MEKKKKIERSSFYPSLTLEDALARLVQLKDSMGLNGAYKRETVASGIGYSTVTGTSARAVAALVHYGLLERDKDLYTISPLGRRYLLPTGENDTQQAVREAAVRPRLFSQLYDEFKGQVLPKLLVNILATKYGIQPKAAPSVVRLFEATMTFAGLLEPNGRIVESAATENSVVAEQDAEAPIAPPSPVSTSVATPRLEITSEKPFNEQGVNHAGDGWALTVIVKSSHRLPSDLRKAIRDLLESADAVADQFYDIEQKAD